MNSCACFSPTFALTRNPRKPSTQPTTAMNPGRPAGETRRLQEPCPRLLLLHRFRLRGPCASCLSRNLHYGPPKVPKSRPVAQPLASCQLKQGQIRKLFTLLQPGELLLWSWVAYEL
jgi:hypothetical protein